MTTGQPIRVPTDRNKYDNEFMENLRLQIKLNDANLQANRLYTNTGQLPPSVQMSDTRSTAEKLADVEGLKKSIVADLKPVAESTFAYAIIEGVLKSPLNVDNSLFRYLAQNAVQLASQLSKKYKFGIAGDANDVAIIVNFLEDAYNKTNNSFQSIKSYINSNTNFGLQKGSYLSANNTDNVILELRDIEKRLDYFINLSGRAGGNRAYIAILRPLYDIVRDTLNFLPTSEQLDICIKTIQQNPPDSQQALFYSVLDILKNLPRPSSLQTITDKIERGIKNNDINYLREASNKFMQLWAQILDPTNRATLNNFYRVYITQANDEIRRSNYLNEVQELGEIYNERGRREVMRKAEKVYIINPEDDPANVTFREGTSSAPIGASSSSSIPASSSSIPASSSYEPASSSSIPASSSSEQTSNPTFHDVSSDLSSSISSSTPQFTKEELETAIQQVRNDFRDSKINATEAQELLTNLSQKIDNLISSQFNQPNLGLSSSSSIPVKKQSSQPIYTISESTQPSSSMSPELSSSSSSSSSSSTKYKYDKEGFIDVQNHFTQEVNKDLTHGLLSEDQATNIKAYIDNIIQNAEKDKETVASIYSKIKNYIKYYKENLKKKENKKFNETNVSKQQRSRYINDMFDRLNGGEKQALEEKINETGNNVSAKTRQVRDKNIIAYLNSLSIDEYNPIDTVELKRFGIGGLGLKKTKKGRGLSSDYRDFGINKINHKKLDDGILTLRRKSNSNIPDMPSKRISRKLQKIIKHISGGGMPDFNEVNNLEDHEKDYLHKLVSKSNLTDRLSVPAPSKDQEEKDFHQFEVMKGEIMSGNDSKELVKKFKILILKLSKQNILPKNEVNELLQDLLSLGY